MLLVWFRSINMFVSFLLLVGLSASFASPVFPDQRTVEDRIVGGRNGTIEEVPYQVSVLVDGNHNCGGSIITEFWIVSAAHCFYRALERYSVRAGSSLRNAGGVIHELETFINHPSYGSPATYSNDISLLKVVEPIQFSAQIQPIPLPIQLQHFPADTICIISGYGLLNWSVGPVPIYVQIAEVPLVPLAECRLAYSEDTVTDDMICAGFLEEGGVDACQGDSGGPLVIDGILHGVVSWGHRCAVAGRPGVYARTSYFIDWINAHTGF